jgi:arsenite methyltransferase
VEAGLKAACAAAYASPVVQWLLGGELHPGGETSTRRALELIDARPGERLLDVASGTGASAMLAARESGCSVVGIEYGESAVEEARRAAEGSGLGDRIRFAAGDAEALPLEEGSFDAVLCECSLCTFDDKPGALREIRRVLRPGGRLALADVVADQSRLPAELSGALARIACVGEALDSHGYLELLSDSGLCPGQVERRDEDAAALAQRVHDRLRAARILGLDAPPDSPVGIEEALGLVAAARDAIVDEALGYAIFTATR